FTTRIIVNQIHTWEGPFIRCEYENIKYEIEQELEEMFDSWISTNCTLITENINYKINFMTNEFIVTMEREYDD
ncbi:7028_t:CDS:1, partial [Scutellospora calospora]